MPQREIRVQRVHPSARYEIFEHLELGRGRFGVVHVCSEWRHGQKYAIKRIRCGSEQEKKGVELEIRIMLLLNNPRFIQLCDVFDYQNEVSLVLEMVDGGELFERVVRKDFHLSEEACKCFIRQIVEGVRYMHSREILHLDLKPENIMCVTRTGTHIKIIDFGMARFHDTKHRLRVHFGTPEFVAPEVVNFDPVGYYTDMWSVGVICYTLLSGLSPFVGHTEAATLANVLAGRYDFKYKSFARVSPTAKAFIRKLLVRDGWSRITAGDALEQPWLTGGEVGSDEDWGDKGNVDEELALAKAQLRRYVIRKRWNKVINTVLALQRMGAKWEDDAIGGGSTSSSSSSSEPEVLS